MRFRLPPAVRRRDGVSRCVCVCVCAFRPNRLRGYSTARAFVISFPLLARGYHHPRSLSMLDMYAAEACLSLFFTEQQHPLPETKAPRLICVAAYEDDRAHTFLTRKKKQPQSYIIKLRSRLKSKPKITVCIGNKHKLGANTTQHKAHDASQRWGSCGTKWGEC